MNETADNQVTLTELRGDIKSLSESVAIFFAGQKEHNRDTDISIKALNARVLSRGKFSYQLFFGILGAVVMCLTPASAIIGMYVNGKSAQHVKEEEKISDRIDELKERLIEINEIQNNLLTARGEWMTDTGERQAEIRNQVDRNTLDLSRTIGNRWSSEMEKLRNERNLEVFNRHSNDIEVLKSELRSIRKIGG